jgi:hypothetical protein
MAAYVPKEFDVNDDEDDENKEYQTKYINVFLFVIQLFVSFAAGFIIIMV